MKEPQVSPDGVNFVPMSQAPRDVLVRVIFGPSVEVPGDDGCVGGDWDFMRRYAAICLREKGLT